MQFILGPGVRLRLPREEDVDELYALIAANRAHLARWLPWAGDQTRAATLDFISAVLAQQSAGDGMQTAITVDGAIAGMVGVHGISWAHESTTIGYWLAEGHQGRGIMTASVRAYTDHAFGTWGLNRLELRAAIDNVRSRAVAERLGFTQEGVLRQAERVDERRLDLALYSMLAADWPGAAAP